MRKITILSMITLDGVLQAPGGPEEDRSGGFKYGGWVAPFSDEVYRQAVTKELEPADYLLGRKTYEIWAGYWPKHGDFWPGINSGMKYVFSKNLSKTDPMVTGWQHSIVLDNVEDIKKLKHAEGPAIQVWGSSKLAQLLLEHDLVDELRLKIHPITLGQGKKLFEGGTIPAKFQVTESIVTPKGVVILALERAGEVETGRAGPTD